jgi:putative ABC transport system substrate-binding protein
MNRKTFWLLAVLLLISFLLAEAQQPTKVPRIGYLTAVSLSAQLIRIEAFRQGLRELDYVEGKNIVIEWRGADGIPDRLPALAAELVRLKVDIVVSGGPTVTRPVKEATTTIPIVMTFDNDPVGSGFVASLAHPGGNITGLSTLAPDIGGKQLELLKEILPRLTRVVVLGSSIQAGNAQSLSEIELAARAFRVQHQYLDIKDHKDIEIAFQAAHKAHADAVLVLISPLIFSERREIADLAAMNRLPAIYPWPEFVEDGLMSYGARVTDLDRRAATYVDKILKGAKPSDLPVEQPTKFELVINLKTAKQIAITIPQRVLARADRVIKERRQKAGGR